MEDDKDMHSHCEVPRLTAPTHTQAIEEAISLQREVNRLRGVLDAILEVNCRTDSDTLLKVRELASNGLRRASLA